MEELPRPQPESAEITLRRQNAYLAALHETAVNLAKRLEFTELLTEILSRAAELLGTENGFLSLINHETDEMVAHVGIGPGQQFIGQRRKRGMGLAGKAWEQGTLLYVPNYQTWDGKLAGFQHYYATVVLPIFANQEIIGVLGLSHSQPENTFSDEELRLLERFGALVSVAWENARLYTAVQQELLERQRTESILRQSEARYRALLAAIPDILFQLNRDGVFLDFSAPDWQNLFYSPEQFLGQKISALFPRPLATIFYEALHQATHSGEIQTLEYSLPTQNGERDFEARVVVSGENEVITIVRDITDKRVAKMALMTRLRYEEQLAACSQALLANTPDSLSQALSHLLMATGTSRAYIFENYEDPHDGTCTRQICEVCAPEIASLINNPALQHFPYHQLPRWREMLSQGEPIHALMSELPLSERLFVEDPTVLSILNLPIQVNGRWYGLLGFDDTLHPRRWSEEDILLLKTAADMIGAHIARQQAEEILRQSEERFRNSFEYTAIGMALTDRSGRFIQVNPAMAHILGYSPQEFLELTFQNLTHPDDLQNNLNNLRQMLAGQITSFQEEIRYLHKTGHLVWGQANISAVRDGRQQILYFIAQIQDITQRKAAEEALRESKQQLSQFLEAMPVGAFVIHANGQPAYMNQSAQAILGLTALDSTDITHMPPQYGIYRAGRKEELYPLEALPLAQALNGKTLIQDDIEIVRADQVVPIEMRGTPIYDQNGQVAYALAVLQDISGRKEIEQRLIQARDRALEASNLKSELLAKVSHELRTPLGAILGYTEMIREGIYGSISDEQKEILNEVLESTTYLTNIVNELLDQAQLESGKLKLNFSTFSPVDLVRQVHASTKVLAHHKSLLLSTSISADVPEELEGDPARLQQILTNLISNAIKFTEVGEIQVRAFCPTPTQWAMEVRDTGLGIPPEAFGYIFEPFRQVDGSRTRRQGGSGLGLSIVKQLVHLMGGEIALKSTLGEGSVFTVILPLQLERS